MMSWLRLRRIWLFGALCVVCCTGPPPSAEEQLRQLLNGMIVGIEEQDPRAILEHVATDFSTEDGLDYADVDALLMKFLLQGKTLGARLEELKIRPEADSDRIRVLARVLFSTETRLHRREVPVPDTAVLYQLDLVFRRVVNRWQASYGTYERL